MIIVLKLLFIQPSLKSQTKPRWFHQWRYGALCSIDEKM